MLTFAYGSNMDCHQMKDRCPSVRFVCVAALRDHRLYFPRKSNNWNCGVAGVEPCKDSKVWGVVYQIDELDVGKLNKHEGYLPGRDENSYVPQERHVYEGNDGEKPICAWVYMACPEEKHPLPNKQYMQLIIDGAKFWNLCAQYIRDLEQRETSDQLRT